MKLNVKTLGERFEESGGKPLDVGGALVHSIYRHQIMNGQMLRVRWVSAVAQPVQGLRMKLAKGRLLINGQKNQDVVLWADTSPPEVEVVCHSGSLAGTQLRVWNCWRGPSTKSCTRGSATWECSWKQPTAAYIYVAATAPAPSILRTCRWSCSLCDGGVHSRCTGREAIQLNQGTFSYPHGSG